MAIIQMMPRIWQRDFNCITNRKENQGVIRAFLEHVSLDEPEPVDSVLTFLSGYDTLEYSWVKATAVSVRLRILFVTLQNTNKLSGAVAGEW